MWFLERGSGIFVWVVWEEIFTICFGGAWYTTCAGFGVPLGFGSLSRTARGYIGSYQGYIGTISLARSKGETSSSGYNPWNTWLQLVSPSRRRCLK